MGGPFYLLLFSNFLVFHRSKPQGRCDREYSRVSRVIFVLWAFIWRAAPFAVASNHFETPSKNRIGATLSSGPALLRVHHLIPAHLFHFTLAVNELIYSFNLGGLKAIADLADSHSLAVFQTRKGFRSVALLASTMLLCTLAEPTERSPIIVLSGKYWPRTVS